MSLKIHNVLEKIFRRAERDCEEEKKVRNSRQSIGSANPTWHLQTTWMEPEAEKLIAESQAVNIIDQEQYPSSTDIQNRCSVLAFCPIKLLSLLTRIQNLITKFEGLELLAHETKTAWHYALA